mmetsp:Transcript_46817/g.130383  ORF Transcript_46817/g.130383 Transcript_46817/m.130383 type:complete len:99 (-) Transcript_46817:71-367(-)
MEAVDAARGWAYRLTLEDAAASDGRCAAEHDLQQGRHRIIELECASMCVKRMIYKGASSMTTKRRGETFCSGNITPSRAFLFLYWLPRAPPWNCLSPT